MDAGGGGGGLIVILGIDSGGGTVTDDFEWRGIDSAQHDIIIKCWFLKQFFFFYFRTFYYVSLQMFLKNCEKNNKFVIDDIDSLDGKKKGKILWGRDG